ncbi:MAG TPA: hypothetical protein VGA02_00355 [Gemmatimonadales bacterium]|jgi:hypothetical protein
MMRSLRWLPALLVIAATTGPHAAAPLCGLLNSGMPMHDQVAMPSMPGPRAAIHAAGQSGGQCNFSECSAGPTAPVQMLTWIHTILPVPYARPMAPSAERPPDPTAPPTPPPQA